MIVYLRSRLPGVTIGYFQWIGSGMVSGPLSRQNRKALSQMHPYQVVLGEESESRIEVD